MHLIANIKYGGGFVKLWFCEAVCPPKASKSIHGIMDSGKYPVILNQSLAASAKQLKLGRGWIFQQDNNPKHTSKLIQK